MSDTIMRRKLSRREMLVLASKGVAALGFASIASACSQPAAPAPAPAEPAAAGGEQKAAEAPQQQAPAQEEVTIEFITPGALGLERTMYENFILKFAHEENPGIKVNVTFEAWGDYMTKLPTILAGGVIPDMIHQHMSIVQEYAYRGALLELNPYMERDGVKAEDYIPALFDAFSNKGKTYGIPKDSAAWGMYFNKTMFDEAGVDYPAEDWTLEDFKELALELTLDENGNPASSPNFDREKIAQWGMAWREPTPAGGGEDSRGFVKAAGGDWFSEDYTEMLLTDPAVLDILKMFYEMRCVTGSIPTPAQAQGQGDPFRAGLTAMQVSFHIGTFFAKQENVKFDYDVRFLPGGPGGQYSVVGCSGWAVPSKAAHKEEGWELVKYLTSMPVQTYIGEQKRWGVSLKDAVGTIEPDDGYPENFAKVHTDPFKGSVDVEVISLKFPPQMSRIREIFAGELEPAWTCTTDDIETAASNAKTQIDEVLAELNW
jgi:multiple sugar transport system substrate-binding protein